MGLKQFTYTASPWGISAPGWTVFQYTTGFEPALAKHFKAYYSYENLGGDAKSPRKLIFAGKENHGQAILSQGCDCGLRWWDTKRGQNYFTHVYLGESEKVLADVNVDFNPLAWYGSKCFQENQNEFSSKADQTGEKTSPPRLDVLKEASGISELQTNPDFNYEALLKRGESLDWETIGRIVGYMHRRIIGTEKNPLVFDARSSQAIDAMALGLRLLPLEERKQAIFSTWLAHSEMAEFPEKDKLLFYGTIPEGKMNVSGIGLYVELPKDGPDFKNSKEVEIYRSMLDSCGKSIRPEDFDAFLACWKLVTGRGFSTSGLRSSFDFAKRFPGLAKEIESSLANALAVYIDGTTNNIPEKVMLVSTIAFFEFGIKSFKALAGRVCMECVHDFELLAKVLQELNGNDACMALLNEIEAQTKGKDATIFVNGILNTNIPLDRYAEKMPNDSLLRLALEYRSLSQSYFANSSSLTNAPDAMNIVNKLLKKAGPGVKGIEEIESSLGYRNSLLRINKIDDVYDAFSKFKGAWPKGANVQADIQSRVNPTSVRDFVELGKAMNALGLKGWDMICEKWQADRNRIAQTQNPPQNTALQNTAPKTKTAQTTTAQIPTARVSTFPSKPKSKFRFVKILFLIIICIILITSAVFGCMGIAKIFSRKNPKQVPVEKINKPKEKERSRNTNPNMESQILPPQR